jgi:hypothetical protein
VHTPGKPFAIIKLENQCCVDALVDYFRHGDDGQPITFRDRVLNISTMPWVKEPRLFTNAQALRTTYEFAILQGVVQCRPGYSNDDGNHHTFDKSNVGGN